MQGRVGGVGRELKITTSPLGIEAGTDGYRLKQRGLTTPVLSHQERHRPVKIEGLNGGNRGNVEWIDGLILDLRPKDLDFDEPSTDSDHKASVLLRGDTLPFGRFW